MEDLFYLLEALCLIPLDSENDVNKTLVLTHVLVTWYFLLSSEPNYKIAKKICNLKLLNLLLRL
jgi:hypothetical protein